jgi:RNA polymerase sigma factor (sigma-70 family)
MIEDVELLRRYAHDRSEAAFAELVRRRIDLVYSVARRQVGGDAQLAEDVTQKVFADLARKAAALAGRAVLTGWLYRSAQFAAADVVRSERRRRARERETPIMNDAATNPDGAIDWEKTRPMLDEAMSELGEEDRDAVALRYFENRAFADIGGRLQLTEEAARKRVTRALEKLHGLLARRGLTSTTTAALAVALTNQAGVAAPAGLAATVTSAILAGTIAGSAGWLTTFMSITKLQIGIASAAALAVVTGSALQRNSNEELRREIAALRGQQPAIAALRAENQQLAGRIAEVEMLRRDDLELKDLAQKAAEAKKANEESLRLARDRDHKANAQAELDRLNREGNALVEEYKDLSEKSNNPSLSPEAKTVARAAAERKLDAIKLKMREAKAYSESARAAGLLPPPAANPEFRRPARPANLPSPPSDNPSQPAPRPLP